MSPCPLTTPRHIPRLGTSWRPISRASRTAMLNTREPHRQARHGFSTGRTSMAAGRPDLFPSTRRTSRAALARQSPVVRLARPIRVRPPSSRCAMFRELPVSSPSGVEERNPPDLLCRHRFHPRANEPNEPSSCNQLITRIEVGVGVPAKERGPTGRSGHARGELRLMTPFLR